MPHLFISSVRSWVVQAAGASVALASLSLLPPAEGSLWIVPLGDADIIAPALDSGAALVDLGPTPGSIIVHGRLEPLARRVSGALILRAPRAGCEPPK